MIHALFSPIHSMRAHWTRRKQTRTALQMLAVSGVVRPSHVELRYGTPLISVGTLRTTISTDVSPAAGYPTSPLAQWVRTLPTTMRHLVKKPVGLQWNAD